MIRVRGTPLLRGTTRLPAALAMESVVDEFVFIVGPVLVTFLSTTGHATSGVVTAFVLALVGSMLFAARVLHPRCGHLLRPRRRRQPAVRRPGPHRAATARARRPQRPVGHPHARTPGAARRRGRPAPAPAPPPRRPARPDSGCCWPAGRRWARSSAAWRSRWSPSPTKPAPCRC